MASNDFGVRNDEDPAQRCQPLSTPLSSLLQSSPLDVIEECTENSEESSIASNDTTGPVYAKRSTAMTLLGRETASFIPSIQSISEEAEEESSSSSSYRVVSAIKNATVASANDHFSSYPSRLTASNVSSRASRTVPLTELDQDDEYEYVEVEEQEGIEEGKVVKEEIIEPVGQLPDVYERDDVVYERDEASSSRGRNGSGGKQFVPGSAGRQQSAPDQNSNREVDKAAEDCASTEKMTDDDDTAGSDEVDRVTSTSTNDAGESRLLEHHQRFELPSPSVKGPTFNSLQSLSACATEYDFDEVSFSRQSRSEEDEVAIWRLHPSESLSDWTLQIEVQQQAQAGDGNNDTLDSTKRITTYHVHKNMLAVGARKSQFFVSAFQKYLATHEDTNDGTNATVPSCKANVTTVTLAPDGAKLIPDMLDYIYSSEGALNLSTENAVGLRYLSKVFGVKALFKKVMSFINIDMTVATLLPYYVNSCRLKDTKILLATSRVFARSIIKLKAETATQILATVDAAFIYDVLIAPAVESDRRRNRMSCLLAEFCEMHKDKLSGSTFLKLTSEKLLPTIDASVALSMLELEATLVKDDPAALQANNESVAPERKKLTSLQERCIKQLIEVWKDDPGSDLDTDRITEVCSKLPAHVVAKILARTLSVCTKPRGRAKLPEMKILRNDSMKSLDSGKSEGTARSNLLLRNDSIRSMNSASSDAANAVNVKLLREKEAAFEELKAAHEAEIARLTKEHENSLRSLQKSCAEKDQHIANYWKELKRYERLPNAPDGRLVKSGRSHHPSGMPEIGRHADQGYLLASKKHGANYPLFFYNTDDN